MKKAVMFSVPSAHHNGYVWRWRCADSKVESKEAFTLYYDCMMDAQRLGYEVEFTRPQGITAPGGARHGLA